MEKKYEHNGHTYWVKVEPVVNKSNGEHAGYMAWVNNKQPGVLLYGQVVRDGKGKPLLFGDEFTALTNANAIKQSELDRKISN